MRYLAAVLVLVFIVGCVNPPEASRIDIIERGEKAPEPPYKTYQYVASYFRDTIESKSVNPETLGRITISKSYRVRVEIEDKNFHPIGNLTVTFSGEDDNVALEEIYEGAYEYFYYSHALEPEEKIKKPLELRGGDYNFTVEQNGTVIKVIPLTITGIQLTKPAIGSTISPGFDVEWNEVKHEGNMLYMLDVAAQAYDSDAGLCKPTDYRVIKNDMVPIAGTAGLVASVRFEDYFDNKNEDSRPLSSASIYGMHRIIVSAEMKMTDIGDNILLGGVDQFTRHVIISKLPVGCI